jgi:2-amino-4-hydroxy-6-hydroxymethyldihydropteridine diphosphokinase
MHKVYLLLGTNLGDKMAYINQAKQLIGEKCGTIIQQSSIYETAAWGITNQPSFYNQVCLLITDLQPELLMQTLLNIEIQLGRKRLVKFGARIIDIDILFIDDLHVNTALLQVPHPLVQERKFALLPLQEIAPQLVHPIFQKSIETLVLECTDTLEVIKV